MENVNTIKITGIIRSFRLRADVDEKTKFLGENVLDMIRQAIQTSNGKLIKFLSEQGLILGYTEQKNLITTAGRTVLARLLSGDATYSGEINYGLLGTDNTAPTNGDTTLGTEVYRKLASSQTYSANISYVDFYYNATETTGTYEEFGNVIDGTASADTGQLWSHIATGGWVKSGTESLFVSCQYIIN
ncbi:MAG: hypothetical protein GY781_13840 [Gammaproteobacteria bacterium]|nr:hypothetical protein [Gammaproteobacteria bacterium]